MNLKEVTLKEISKRANVSVSTVSAILNNSPFCFAGEKTRKKVIKIAEELGYYPNLLYRSLRNKKTNTIGLIIPHLYYSEITIDIELLESILWDNGYHLFIGYTRNDPKKEEALIKDFLSRRVDGIIFVIGKERNKNKEIEKIINKNFPFITVGRFKNLKTDFISTDYFKGGYIAGKHLYEKGYEKLGILFGKDENSEDLTVKERKNGFLNFAKEKNLEVKEYYIEKGFNNVENLIEESEKIGMKILKEKNRPSGIFASNDEIAVGIIKSALKLGIKIPEELGIIGFDNSLSSILSPIPITTIRQKKEVVAKRAVENIINKIGEKKEKIEEYIEPELIERESTRIRPENIIREKSRACLI
ncbi:MAG: LacI family transcriptional regulator [Candidatus Omnitrophica bacterium]|nr:LacI family transcriptional regulator [Candidatus Omnitrophota bacterium]